MPRSVPLFLFLGLVLTGCVPDAGPTESPSATSEPTEALPTPTPTPTVPPALAGLVLSPAGLGPILIGQAPPSGPPETEPLVFDPDYCPADRPEGPGFWIANYADVPGVWNPGAPFRVSVFEDRVNRIDVNTFDVATDRGVHIGDPEASVIAAYPEAEVIVGGPGTLYVTAGPTGQLIVEVASTDVSYWQDRASTVVVMRVIEPGVQPTGVSATDNVVGCGFV
jgi:hypothetical protein